MQLSKLRRAVVGAFIMLVSGSAAAFTLTPAAADIKGWDTKKLAFHVNPKNCPSSVASLVKAALTLWNSVPTSGLTLERGADTTQSLAQVAAGQGTDVPAIFCSTNFTAMGVDANDIPGFATGAGISPDGHLNDGFLLLNVQPGAQANIDTIDATVVKIIVAHEIGHVLGLGHSADTDALMYYNASLKKNLTLGSDDLAAISYLYPRNELGKDQPMGCGTVAAVTEHQGAQRAASRWPLAILLSLPFAAAVLRLRRSSATCEHPAAGAHSGLGRRRTVTGCESQSRPQCVDRRAL